MALLLPDVYLPKYGSIEIVILPDGSMFEDAYDEIFYTEFPLGTAIELPEHGDLIDKDEAYARWNKGEEDVLYNAPVIVPANKEVQNALP